MNMLLKPVRSASAVTPGSFIFVEGLPGSGKTTMTHKLHLWLGEAGFASRWIGELEMPHPIIGNRMEREMEPEAWQPDRFIEESLAGWEALSQQVRASSEVVVLEGTLLQACAGKLQQMAVSFETIKDYLSRVREILGNLPTHLIYLWQNDPRRAIQAMLQGRGGEFKQRYLASLPRFPFMVDQYEFGESGLLSYVVDYRDFISELMQEGVFKPIMIDATDRQWPRIETQVCAALGLATPRPCQEQLNLFTGRFRCVANRSGR